MSDQEPGQAGPQVDEVTPAPAVEVVPAVEVAAVSETPPVNAAAAEEVPAAAGEDPAAAADNSATEENSDDGENAADSGAEETGTGESTQVALVPEVITTKKKPDEMKVVIMATGTHHIIGISSSNCDPFFKTIDDSLAVVLQAIPELVEQARVQWAISPTYPKAVLPKPPPPPPRSASTSTSTGSTHTVSKKTAAAAPSKAAQPNFF